ncbi:MAG: anti-sigma factor domain-containing protein [Rubrimonas sp.]
MTDPRDLADAHVLGLLDETDASEVDRRVLNPLTEDDRLLRQALGEARDRFLPLDLTAAPVGLSSDAWSRLEAQIDVPRRPAPAPRGGRKGSRPGSTRRPRGWRWAALGGIAASIALAATLAWRIVIVETPAVVAVLLNDAGQAVALVEAFDDDSVLIIPLESVAGDVAGTFQGWTKPDPDGPPVSVGLLDELRRIRIQGPNLPSPSEDQLYEITIEPEGGSPTGLPTGPIVGKGLARRPL